MDRLISEQQVLDAISRIGLLKSDTKEVQAIAECLRAVEALPPVNLQSKIGHWIFHEIEDTLRWYECDQCGAEAVKEYDYCHGCGAKMESEQNE